MQFSALYRNIEINTSPVQNSLYCEDRNAFGYTVWYHHGHYYNLVHAHFVSSIQVSPLIFGPKGCAAQFLVPS